MTLDERLDNIESLLSGVANSLDTPEQTDLNAVRLKIFQRLEQLQIRYDEIKNTLDLIDEKLKIIEQRTEQNE